MLKWIRGFYVFWMHFFFDGLTFVRWRKFEDKTKDMSDTQKLAKEQELVYAEREHLRAKFFWFFWLFIG